MADKKEQLKESIAKLLSLKVSDDEIILNLKDVGLSHIEARRLLDETKNDKSGPVKIEEINKKTVVKPINLVTPNPILKKETVEPEVKKPVSPTIIFPPKKPVSIKIPLFSNASKPIEPVKKISDPAMMDLWEKGIMATVNSKLSEMENLKKGTEEVLDKKIEKALSKQIKKIETVFESQRTLGASHINEALEKKSKEVEEIINMKLAELNSVNSVHGDLLKKLESQKNKNQKVIDETNAKLEDVSKIKSRLVSEMNSELIKSKSEIQKFLDESDDLRKETVNRINRSLELESKIVEGLMTDAKQRIDALALEQTTAIEKSLKGKYEKKSLELDRKLRKIEDLEKKVDLDTIKTTMEELEVFRQQFSDQIKKNVESFNDAKKEIVKEINQKEELLDRQLNILNLKIKEFEAFEQEFAEQIGMQIDKLSEKKRQLKPVKKGWGI